MKIIYLSKNNVTGRRGLELVRAHLAGAEIALWLAAPGDRLPDWPDWSSDILISFLCPRIVPSRILESSKLPINFHPGPPEYPGFGCYNFALYDRADDYGVTCHRMAAKVDSGAIYGVRRFPIPDSRSVVDLQDRSLEHLLLLLADVLAMISRGDELAEISQWTRGPTSRTDFEELRRIPLDATKEEVEIRIAAFEHPDFDGAYVQLHGFDFVATRMGRNTS